MSPPDVSAIEFAVEDYTMEKDNLLHWPARSASLQSVDEHLNSAARLSRALWCALYSEQTDTSDPRDREGLLELASMIADHTSAAEYAYGLRERARTEQGETTRGRRWKLTKTIWISTFTI